jgi:hypothetical protein
MVAIFVVYWIISCPPESKESKGMSVQRLKLSETHGSPGVAKVVVHHRKPAIIRTAICAPSCRITGLSQANCCGRFSHENRGRIGELLLQILTTNIDLSSMWHEELVQIMQHASWCFQGSEHISWIPKKCFPCPLVDKGMKCFPRKTCSSRRD